MKRVYLVILFLLVVNFVFVVAQDDSPTVPVNDEDVEKFQGVIDQLPFDESGETNFTKYKPFVTKAEERINNINSWLDDNAGWMRYLFQMRPQVSVLFALNLYFILFFLLIFVINGEGMWFFIEGAGKARLFGGAVFVAFAAIGLYAGLAYIANNIVMYIWHILIDSAIWLALIAMVIIVILLVFGLVSITGLVNGLVEYLNWKKERKEKLEEKANRGALNAFLDQVKK